MDYYAVGQTLNVAARMEHMAVPGSILISADTLTLAEGLQPPLSCSRTCTGSMPRPKRCWKPLRGTVPRACARARQTIGLCCPLAQV